MFTKLTKSGGHTYVQLVESYRDETGRPRQRTVSTLGRLDEAGGQVDSLLTRVRHQITISPVFAHPVSIKSSIYS